jgi:hypothetical protein
VFRPLAFATLAVLALSMACVRDRPAPTVAADGGFAPACPLRWSYAPTPAGSGPFYAVRALAGNDVWAVERYVAHWDGGAWTLVYGPLDSGQILFSISVLSPTDIWASGRDYSALGAPKDSGKGALVLHWDGVSWNKVIPPPILQGNVAAVADNDVWIAGGADRISGYASIWHWDGEGWTQYYEQVASYFSGISVVTKDDIWAAGNAVYHPELSPAFHWDGVGWKSVPVPAGIRFLNDVAALAADDIWMVSGSNLVHWNGSSFAVTRGPEGIYLLSISGRASDDVWAVGTTQPADSNFQAVIFHWNGQQWADVARPGLGVLRSIAPASPLEVWAVGDFVAHYALTCKQLLPKLAR